MVLKADIELLTDGDRDAVLDSFQKQYGIVEDMLPVILALGNKEHLKP